MIQIYRPEDQQRFLEILESEDIPHNLNEHGQIHYPVSYRNEVEAAREEIWGPVDKSRSGAMVRTKIAEKLSAALTRAGVDFQVSHLPDGTMFRWNIEQNETAMGIVEEVEAHARP